MEEKKKPYPTDANKLFREVVDKAWMNVNKKLKHKAAKLTKKTDLGNVLDRIKSEP